jgi:hypothetical protein
MATPVLEIALAPIKGRTIEDESTADGEIWREIFSHVTNIPGLIRASWGLNQHNRDLNLFLVGKERMKRCHLIERLRVLRLTITLDWESYPHHERFMDEQGTLSKPIMDLMSDDFNMYHIQTTTQSREWLKAPVTSMSFYVNPDVKNFSEPLKILKDTYERLPGCVQVASGDAKSPSRHDPQGWMKGGKSVVIVLSGWESEEALKTALNNPAVIAATKDVEKTPAKVVSFPVTFTVVEKTRYEHRWRRLPPPTLKDIPVG